MTQIQMWVMAPRLSFGLKPPPGDFDEQPGIGFTILNPSYSLCGPSIVHIIWEFVRNAVLDLIRELRNQNLDVNKLLR